MSNRGQSEHSNHSSKSFCLSHQASGSHCSRRRLGGNYIHLWDAKNLHTFCEIGAWFSLIAWRNSWGICLLQLPIAFNIVCIVQIFVRIIIRVIIRVKHVVDCSDFSEYENVCCDWFLVEIYWSADLVTSETVVWASLCFYGVFA